MSHLHATRLARITLLLAAFVCGPAAAAQHSAQFELLGQKLQRQLATIADSASGVMGIAVIDLTTGDRFGVNDTLLFPQGSAIKVPVLLELYRDADRGTLTLGDTIRVRAAAQTGGSGLLDEFSDGGSVLSLHDLAVMMIVLSDNTAANLLIERVGMAPVNADMQALGFPHTRLQRLMIRPAESAAGHENLSTPREAAMIMARIARCALPMSAEHCAEVQHILGITKDGPLTRAVGPNITVLSKDGAFDGVRTTWGAVLLPGRPYAFAAMVNYELNGASTAAIEQAAAAVHTYFTRIAGSTAYGARVPLQYLPAPAHPKTP